MGAQTLAGTTHLLNGTSYTLESLIPVGSFCSFFIWWFPRFRWSFFNNSLWCRSWVFCRFVVVNIFFVLRSLLRNKFSNRYRCWRAFWKTKSGSKIWIPFSVRFSVAGYPEHMTLSDFRCHFQALSPPIMKRYASMFVSHDERKVRWPILAARALAQMPRQVSSVQMMMSCSPSLPHISGGGGAAGWVGPGEEEHCHRCQQGENVFWTRRQSGQQNVNPAHVTQGSSSCRVSGVYEARRAALPGAAEGPAGHWLVVVSTSGLLGSPGPSEVPQTQG